MEEQSGSIFPRRALTAKAALDPRLRCTEVDENGDVIMVDGELKKSELIAKVHWSPLTGWILLRHMLTVDITDSTASFHEISARSTRPTFLIFLSGHRPFY